MADDSIRDATIVGLAAVLRASPANREMIAEGRFLTTRQIQCVLELLYANGLEVVAADPDDELDFELSAFGLS